MKVTINVPDDLFDTYEHQAVSSKVTTEVEIANRLKRFQDIANSERCLTIYGKDRLKLEAIFQTTLETPDRLYNQVRNTACLKIGVIERPFSPSEVIRLQDQARFHGWSEQKFLELTSNEALDYVFNRL